jgi:hypothetical protein
MSIIFSQLQGDKAVFAKEPKRYFMREKRGQIEHEMG